MTTRLYLGNGAPNYVPTTERGSWTSTTSHGENRLSQRRAGQSNSITLGDVVTTNPFQRLCGKFVSDPLQAMTVAGTIDLMLLCSESDAAANMSTKIHIFLTTGDTDTVRATLLSAYVDATEWPVGSGVVSALHLTGISLTSQSATAGDRIVIELGYSAANAVSTLYNGLIKLGGATDDAVGTESNLNPILDQISQWVEFSDALLFDNTYLFLTSDAAPVTPGATRGTWDDATSPVDKYMDLAPSGARDADTRSETSVTTWDTMFFRCVSDELAAQTIDQTIKILSGMNEASGTVDAFAKYHLYAMKPDGTVRGTLLSNQLNSGELPSIGLQLGDTFTPTSVAVLDGDRLVLEIGASFTNSSGSSQSVTGRTGGPSGMLTNATAPSNTSLSPYIEFDQVLLWYVVPPSVTGRSHVVVAG